MPPTAKSAARKDKTNAKGATFEHRHFAALAAMLAELHTNVMPRQDGTWLNVVNHFADHLADTNPRFDRARFLVACGV